MKNLFSTLRHPNIIISKHIVKAQLAISSIFSRRNFIFFPAENYTCVRCQRKKKSSGYGTIKNVHNIIGKNEKQQQPINTN
jgi:hypothetical protein